MDNTSEEIILRILTEILNHMQLYLIENKVYDDKAQDEYNKKIKAVLSPINTIIRNNSRNKMWWQDKVISNLNSSIRINILDLKIRYLSTAINNLNHEINTKKAA